MNDGMEQAFQEELAWRQDCLLAQQEVERAHQPEWAAKNRRILDEIGGITAGFEKIFTGPRHGYSVAKPLASRPDAIKTEKELEHELN